MSNENSPMVSVVMATFNEPKKFIEESIGSILNQTHQNLELLIADDSTSEDTIKAIDEFAATDKRVVVIRKEQRMGFVNALNECLNVAKGDFIARMDGDDISRPQRFEIELKYAEANPNVMIWGGDIDTIDENGSIISERRYPTTESSIKRMFVFRSPFAHPTVMFRRCVIDKGFRYNPLYKKDEDLDLWLRLYKGGFKFGNTGEKVLKYRVVGDITKKRDRSQLVYNHKARRENYDWKRPVFSVMSWGVSLMYLIIPMKLFSMIYKRENSRGNQ